MPLKDTDYLYSSARIRAASGSITPREQLERLLDAADVTELLALIRGNESPSEGASVTALLDAALDDRVAQAVALAETSVPEPALLDFLLYQYDCTNIKTAVKCMLRGINPIPSDMLYRCGTVAPDLLAEMVMERSFGALPPHMAEAVPAALDSYMKTKDPRMIDFLLDAACYADIIGAAANCGSPLLLSMMRQKADYANLMTYLRTVRSFDRDSEAGLSSLRNALVPGGLLEEKLFTDAYVNPDADAFANALKTTEYRALAETVTAGLPFSEMEKICDDLWLSNLQQVKFQAFGIEVIAQYIISTEYEAKNCRIIRAGLTAGQSADKIREKVRFGYV